MSFGYRWWPSYKRGLVEYDASNTYLMMIVADLVVGGVLCLPPVVRATGVSASVAIGVVLTHWACVYLNGVPLHRAAQRSVALFNLQLAMALIYNVGLCLVLVVASGDPRTPIWSSLLIYACICGALQEVEANWIFLAAFAFAPLLTIPFFHARHGDWALAGPLWAAVTAAAVYHVIAMSTAKWREVRGQLRERVAELERAQIAQELHDSVGAALGLSGMYGDLIERNLGDPASLRALAQDLRETTAQGLDDLRGVLDALAPEAARLADLTRSLQLVAARMSAPAGARVRLESAAPGELHVDGPLRLAMVRVFQEAISNALRHGAAREIDASLRLSGDALLFFIRDDGRGFDPMQAPRGRGLTGMRRRAESLGGSARIDSSPGAGTTVSLSLPVRPPVSLPA